MVDLLEVKPIFYFEKIDHSFVLSNVYVCVHVGCMHVGCKAQKPQPESKSIFLVRSLRSCPFSY